MAHGAHQRRLAGQFAAHAGASGELGDAGLHAVDLDLQRQLIARLHGPLEASAVSQDVPPFILVDGNPLQVRGFHQVGLRRRGFSPERMAAVKQMHKVLYRQGRTLDDARAAIGALAGDYPDAAGDIAAMDTFLSSSTRGIAR